MKDFLTVNQQPFELNATNVIVDTRHEVNAMSASVLKVLLYYDLFRYPLTAEEITRHCSEPSCTINDIQHSLDMLCTKGIVTRYDQYYSPQKDKTVFERRMKGNRKAEEVMSKARKKAALIGSFPFVRCVCVSGSLSKNYFDETTDIDFFIITEPGRLWLCRSLLILYKKIFLRKLFY